MSPYILTGEVMCIGFPRVSGDEPLSATPLTPHGQFSPRERG